MIGCLFVTTLVCFTVVSAQTVDEIVQKNIGARGLERIRAIKSLRMTAKIHADNLEIPAIFQVKRPGMARADAELQGMKLVKAYDGKSGWQINMFEGKPGPERMTGDDEKDLLKTPPGRKGSSLR
jgi:hypothetical protein